MPPSEADQPLDLMTILAHPDDEAFGMGGTLSRYADAGLRVACVCATRGEVGEISDPALATTETLPEVRQREMEEACRVIGTAIPPIFLDHRDSGMEGTPPNQDERALISQPEGVVADQLVAILRRWRPRAVATFEPGGGYGHPDHIYISRVAMAAVAAAADAKHRSDLGRPHQPDLVLQGARARGVFRDIIREAQSRGIDLHVPAGADLETRGVNPDLIGYDLVIDMERKRASFMAHRTQLNPDSIFFKLPQDLAVQALGHECYIQVHPPLDPGSPALDDIFARLTPAARGE